MDFPEITSKAGHRVIIYTTNAGGDYPIHGAYWPTGVGEWIPLSWKRNGRRIDYKLRSRPSDLDICHHIGPNGQILIHPVTIPAKT